MAKESEFVEILQRSVIGSEHDALIAKRDELKKALAELEANVIKEPEAIDNLKKQISELDKKILQNETQTQQVMDPSHVEEEKVEIQQDDEALSKEEKKKQSQREEELRQAYYNAMVALYEKRIASIDNAVMQGKLVVDREDFEAELKLEADMHMARDNYMQLGKEDPYTQKRTELIRKEKDAKEQIELELREKARKYKELQDEIKNIDKEIAEINEQLLDPEITETQIKNLNARLEELQAKRTIVEQELAKIKEDLEPAIMERRKRALERSGLEEKHVATLTDEDRKNYNYQQSKIDKMNANFDQATQQEYDNIKRRIEEREKKIKDINQELKKMEDAGDTDFERRLMLLNELDRETNMLEADREAKADLDRGVQYSKEEMSEKIDKKVKVEEERQEEFDKATQPVREVVKAKDEQLGAESVARPLEAAGKKQRGIDETAAVIAMAVDKDTVGQNVMQYVGAKCVIEGLEKQVNHIDQTPEGVKNAEAALAQDEKLRQADARLKEVQEGIKTK